MFPAGVSYGESRKIESTLSDTQVVEARNSKRGNACRNLTAINNSNTPTLAICGCRGRGSGLKVVFFLAISYMCLAVHDDLAARTC